MCWISKGTHKKKQSAFYILMKEANVAEISGRLKKGGGGLSSVFTVT